MFANMGFLDWLLVLTFWLALCLFIAQFCGFNGKDADE